MVISHGNTLPNCSQWEEAMWVLALSNHTDRQLLYICFSAKHLSSSTFFFHLFCFGYLLLLFLRYINTIKKFYIEQNRLNAIINAQWKYYLLCNFTPEAQLPIVEDLLILFFTLLYVFPTRIHANNTTFLQTLKNPPI